MSIGSDEEPFETAESIGIVDRIVGGLDWGRLVFNAPTEISYGASHHVEAVLSPSLSIADLEAQLRQKPTLRTVRADVRLGNRMRAELTPSFRNGWPTHDEFWAYSDRVNALAMVSRLHALSPISCCLCSSWRRNGERTQPCAGAIDGKPSEWACSTQQL